MVNLDTWEPGDEDKPRTINIDEELGMIEAYMEDEELPKK